MTQFISTGQAANAIGVSARRVDYAVQQGHAGHVVYGAGRRLLSPENLRKLARHFGKPIPAEGLADLDPETLAQEGGDDA